MSESSHIVEYARPVDNPFWHAESRRASRLCLALGTQSAVILAHAWGGAAWAKRQTGESVLFAPATGTDAYIYWLIDVPMLVAPIVPIVVGVLTCAMVTLNRWRARFLFILIGCFAAWFLTMFGLMILSVDIDP